jgi:hypothetical protein
MRIVTIEKWAFMPEITPFTLYEEDLKHSPCFFVVKDEYPSGHILEI